jgi:hypothetical protein
MAWSGVDEGGLKLKLVIRKGVRWAIGVENGGPWSRNMKASHDGRRRCSAQTFFSRSLSHLRGQESRKSAPRVRQSLDLETTKLATKLPLGVLFLFP